MSQEKLNPAATEAGASITTNQSEKDSAPAAQRPSYPCIIFRGIIGGADPDHFTQSFNGFIAYYRPTTKIERQLIERIASLAWRIERYSIMKSLLLNAGDISSFTAPPERLEAITLILEDWQRTVTPSQCIHVLNRHLAALHRPFEATTKKLRHFQELHGKTPIRQAKVQSFKIHQKAPVLSMTRLPHSTECAA